MLTRFDPFFSDAFRLQRELLGRAMEQSGEETRTFSPPVDVWEDEDEVLLTVEVPGLKPDQVDIEVDKNVLHVKGERSYEKREDKEGNFRTERFYGSFHRAFTLPDTVDGEQVQAHLEDGLLKLTLPKKAEVKPRKIQIGGAEGQGKLKAA